MTGELHSGRYRHYRLKSFTLPELLVAALLSAILLAVVVTVFVFFLDRISHDTHNMDTMEEAVFLKSSLSRLMLFADSVRYEDDRLIMYDEGAEEASAVFEKEYVALRISHIDDTFRLSHTTPVYTCLNDSPGLVSGMLFFIDMKSFMIPVKITREYEGEVLVNKRVAADEDR